MRFSRRTDALPVIYVVVVFVFISIAPGTAPSSASTPQRELFPIIIDDAIYQWDDEGLALVDQQIGFAG